jgi:type IV secretion system protein VirB10
LHSGDTAGGGIIMSDTGDAELEKRLAALEKGGNRGDSPKPRRSPLLAVIVVALVGAGGTALYMGSGPDEETALPTATPDVFQNEGDGFGAIEAIPPPPAPETQIVVAPAAPSEPNAELLAQLAALQAQIEELRNAPEPVVEEDTAAADAIDGLTAQIAALQTASETAQQLFQDELAARDRELEQIRMDLELAQLEANRPVPAPVPIGPSEEDLLAREAERLRREEEARRMADLERRAAEERAFQERRVTSPIQAVMETALDSSLPGQVRAVVSEDVFSFDGSRLLIPRGSRLIGRYRSGLDIAQQRVTIAWDRIILPDHQAIQISSFGGDELGRSGVTGFVDTRFAERFGSTALISLISAAPSAAAASVEDEATAGVLEDVGDDLADATDSVISDYLSIGPVIYVDQGARVTVMVDRDLEIF